MQDQKKAVCVAALLVAFVLGGIGGYTYAVKKQLRADDSATVEKTEYQAVFLTNGQLYFGRLAGEGTDHPVLTDVYYLQAQADGSGKAPATNAPITLVKFGNEIQGPYDEMRFNPSQIQLVEDLREDGQVVKAIRAKQQAAAVPVDATK